MRARWSKPALVAAALVSVVFAALLVAAVSQPRPRLAATNAQVVASGAVLVVPPGQERCEQGQFVPGEASMLRVFASSPTGADGETLRFSITDAPSGEVAIRRRVDGGYALGPLDVPIDPPGRALADAEVCIENLGEEPMAFAGNRTRLDGPTLRDAQGPEEEIRIDFLRSGEESLWALAPTVARRFAVFKPSFAGPWAMWAVLATAAGAVAAAVLVAARDPSPGAAPPEDGR